MFSCPTCSPSSPSRGVPGSRNWSGTPNVPAGAIAAEMPVTFGVVSQHLKVLLDAHLVVVRRMGASGTLPREQGRVRADGRGPRRTVVRQTPNSNASPRPNKPGSTPRTPASPSLAPARGTHRTARTVQPQKQAPMSTQTLRPLFRSASRSTPVSKPCGRFFPNATASCRG